MRGVAEATANIFFVKTAQDWQSRQDLGVQSDNVCSIISAFYRGRTPVNSVTVIMRISFGKI